LWSGVVVSGLGAATADAAYGSVAAFGLIAAARPLVDQCRPASPGRRGGDVPRLWGAYGSTLLLTVTNPMTILSFAAFAGLGLANGVAGPGVGLTLAAAVFLGSMLWWALLSGRVGLLRGALGTRALRAVNGVAGLLLLGFGLFALTGLRR
jgi:threonine/homoserine/homoserine lactone efflux protein